MMRRVRGTVLLAMVGAIVALVASSGVGRVVVSRWKAGRAQTALSQAKDQRLASAEFKTHEDPAADRIPTNRLLALSGLSPTLGAVAFDVLETSRRRNGAGGSEAGLNVFVNDPCLDPPPTAPFPFNFLRTVQSETDIAVLNAVRAGGDDDGEDGSDEDRHNDNDHQENDHKEDASSGRLMVAGYNNSAGFYDNREGLSGFSYSTDGGRQWIDGRGLPPVVQSGAPAGTPGSDAYFGDPVVAVHHRTKTFFYSSIYLNPAGVFTLSVNRGRFKVAPQQVPVESKANTRCEGNAMLHGVPDPPAFIQERIIWELPVEAVIPVANDDFLDKEWLYVDQKTGFLYLTYTRFGADGTTPIELVRSFDRGLTWTPPTVVVPNLFDTFNTATQAVVTPTGRVVVSWLARTFPAPAFDEREQRIEVAVSDDGGTTFGPPIIVDRVNPQGPPPGFNRTDDSGLVLLSQILNVPYLAVDKGRDDGVTTMEERRRPGYGNVYLTYYNGKTAFARAPNPPTTTFASAGDILLSTSGTDGTTWRAPVKVNDDTTNTSHVFSSVQVNDLGEIFVTWIDRRIDPARNLLSDTYGDISSDSGRRLGSDLRITSVSTDWLVRADAQPNFGDYNSSEVIGFRQFLSIWADGRFPTPAPLTPIPTGGVTRPVSQSATPDSLMAVIGRR